MNIKLLLFRYKFLVSSPIFGLAIAFLMFYLADLEKWISISCFITSFVLPLIYILINELIRKTNRNRNIRGSERSMETVIRIENESGDATLHSRIKITNSDKNSIHFLYRDVYTTTGPSITMEEPKLIRSSINNLTISERAKIKYSKKIVVNDIECVHNYIECDYRLNPPLRGKGDFVEYDLNVKAEEYCKDAFADSGTIEGFIVKNAANVIEMKLVTFNNYQLELLDCWIENEQAKRFDLEKFKTNSPTISKTGHELTWKLEYPRTNHLYLFKYRTIKR